MKTPPALFVASALLCAAPLSASPPTADSPNSGFRIAPPPAPSSYLLSWWGASDTFYFLQQSTDLVNWSLAPMFRTGSGAPLDQGLSTDEPRMFFRLKHTDDPESEIMQSDLDGDGLTVYQEYLLGSDPFNPDTSGNGIFDGIALKLGMTLTAPPAPLPDPNDTTPPAILLHTPTSATLLP